jgi:hypothetical protein
VHAELPLKGGGRAVSTLKRAVCLFWAPSATSQASRNCACIPEIVASLRKRTPVYEQTRMIERRFIGIEKSCACICGSQRWMVGKATLPSPGCTASCAVLAVWVAVGGALASSLPFYDRGCFPFNWHDRTNLSTTERRLCGLLATL